jgi:A/G-specific adenine glycosylase
MHAAAQVIVTQHGGTFPRDFAAALALPGIGRYTAGAILSIAFDDRHPILEANSSRVLSRLLAFRGDPQSTAGQRTLWSFAEQLLPRRQTGAFNQAVMELGSLVCTPKLPACETCPAFTLCPTQAQGLQDRIPQPKKKKHYTRVREVAAVVHRRGKVLVRQCGPDERWSGLWDFPRFGISAATARAVRREAGDRLRQQTGVDAKLGEKLTTIKHGVTRYRITLDCYLAAYTGRVKGARPDGPQRWVRPAELGELPLSVTGRKIARLIHGAKTATL